ncbi:MAG: hypothetical protein H6Q25_456 [Bacteroidetes bacterium]|nr:hypothetical protein [Bacteroidota bacterium]
MKILRNNHQYTTLIIKAVILIISATLFMCCSPRLLLQKRTKRLVEKSYQYTDTIYLYTVAFSNSNLIWYHKNEYIYSCFIGPYKIKKYKPIEAKNITVNDSIDKYFDNTFYKDIPCFRTTLDGEGFEMYVKDKDVKWSSINVKCLFQQKYGQNSFPYKLQYDFSKLLKYKDFEIDTMYLK